MGIEENSGIGVRVLWTSLNQDGGVGFSLSNENTDSNFDRFVGCGVQEVVKPQTKSEQIPQFKKSTETKTSEPKQPDIKKLITDSF